MWLVARGVILCRGGKTRPLDLVALIRTGQHDYPSPAAKGSSFSSSLYFVPACSCSGLIVLLLLFCCSLLKSVTHSHTLLDPYELPSVAQPQSTGCWYNLCSDGGFSLTPLPELVSSLSSSSPTQLFVFSPSLSLVSYSILWGNDKKCHLRPDCLPWFPWQLQQQPNMPLGPGGPRRPPASHSLWEGGSGGGRWQVVYARSYDHTENESVCLQLIDGTGALNSFREQPYACVWSIKTLKGYK